MRTLQELNDREDLRDLRLAYTHHFDGGDLDALLRLFVDDAITDFGPFGVWRGKDEMRAGWSPYFTDRKNAAPYAYGRHVVTNPELRVDGDTAWGRWFLIDVSFYAKGEVRKDPVVLYGTYEDEYRRVFGSWKITKTTLHFHWPVPGGAPSGLVR
jgi:ketosteroid isomerase-like protein